MELETIIGLETHIQLRTKSKLFCSCSNDGENQLPNTTICPICLGHPGTLPVLNKQALDYAILMALALHMEIGADLKFDRKNYFYPDLPKGYQISQFDQPVGKNGFLSIFGSNFQKKIQIERLHLEEDAAKNIHSTDKTLVDYNRGGTPLIEIVSCPDLTSPQEAKAYMQELRLLARYLGVSDADMEKGHLRCDANISLRPIGEQKYWPKTEIKNINSFRFVEKALIFEVARQKQLWLSDEPPSQQSTRGWDAQTGTTYEQRLKEESNDYRFFPEPDLPPLHISSGYLEQIRHQLVELPAEKRARFKKEFELVGADVEVLVEDYLVADYFEKVMSELQDWLNTEMIDDEDGAAKLAKNKLKLARTAFGWITTELFKLMKEAKEEIGQIKITPENMAEFITLVYLNKINSSAAQIILQEMYFSGADPEHVLEEKNLSMISGNDELSTIINQIIINNPEQANDYRTGKSSLLQYFIGLAMKETKGRADPQILARLFKAKLNIE